MINTVHNAIQAAHFLWPRFGLRDGAVLAVDHVGAGSTPVTSCSSLTEAEIFLNHVHVLDYFENLAGLEVEPWWDQEHPDSVAACELGMLAAECWAAKLGSEYSDRRFKVFYTQDDNPVVRFHQVRDGEPPFLSEQDWADGIQEGHFVVHTVGGAE